jgi:hypothetical protein
MTPTRDDVLRFHRLPIADPPPTLGRLTEIEPPRTTPLRPPAFVRDLSHRDLTVAVPGEAEIHGSDLVHRADVLLFGSSTMISPAGYWFNEARQLKRQWLHYVELEFYNIMFPGLRPKIEFSFDSFTLDVADLAESGAVRLIEEPVFLATPLEPPIWARWICTVIPKVRHYLRYGIQAKFMCHVGHQWQLDVLRWLGIRDEQILPHDPGATYICRDLTTVEITAPDLKISQAEQRIFQHLTRACGIHAGLPEKLFVSRLSRSRANPNYRALQNEAALAERLTAAGFALIEPEYLPFHQQIMLFSRAREIVCLGGSALFNAVFSPADARVVTIESSANYIDVHAGFLGALPLDYAVIFGAEDAADKAAHHRRWSLDLEPALDLITGFTTAPR